MLIFRLDNSLGSAIILTALELLDVQVFQYDTPTSTGQLVNPCTGVGATPDPCVQKSLDTANNDWQHGWREVARRQRAGELGTVALYTPKLERRRVEPYGIRHVPVTLGLEPPAPGTYVFSAMRHARAR